MSEFSPVRTKADLETLDNDEIVAGYRFGAHGGGEPGSDKSRAFWHGWRNSQIDRGAIPVDDASGALIRDLFPNMNPRLS
jgi:hypothetical protein